MNLRPLIVSAFFVLLVLASPTTAAGANQLTQQVGAMGDDASRGNLGVRAEIRTRLYTAAPAVLDYFWVGTILQNGAFIQFGYAFEPVYFCLKGSFVNGNSHCDRESALLSDTDARWQWQYWPNLYDTNFYYEIGPANSAGVNGTWHLYSIVSGSDRSVSFVIDGEQVANIGFKLQPSEQPPMMVAEKITSSNEFTSLGPVEFRNLAYLKEDGWHLVDSLISLSGCGISARCPSTNPYGVSVEGANLIVAGTGGQITANGQLLWTSNYVTLTIAVHSGVAFRVSTVVGNQEFVDNASTKLPKGLFAEVLMTTTRTRTNGVFGALGAIDEFQGWTGYENSRNQSIRILMDQNRSLSAIWHTNLFGVIWTSAAAVAFLVTILGLSVLMLRRHAESTRRPLQGQ